MNHSRCITEIRSATADSETVCQSDRGERTSVCIRSRGITFIFDHMLRTRDGPRVARP